MHCHFVVCHRVAIALEFDLSSKRLKESNENAEKKKTMFLLPTHHREPRDSAKAL